MKSSLELDALLIPNRRPTVGVDSENANGRLIPRLSIAALERRAGLAHRKKKSQRKSPAVTATADSSSDTPTTVSTASRNLPASRGRLIWSGFAALLWIVALTALALSTANRPMLNRVQIEQADLIVTGQIVDVEQGAVTVKQTWRPGRSNRPIRVRNLSETEARNGSTYVLPLTSVGDDSYEITRPVLRRDRKTEVELQRPPRIYEASAAAIEQLREMLH